MEMYSAWKYIELMCIVFIAIRFPLPQSPVFENIHATYLEGLGSDVVQYLPDLENEQRKERVRLKAIWR